MNFAIIDHNYIKFSSTDKDNIIVDRDTIKPVKENKPIQEQTKINFENVLGVYIIDKTYFCAVITQSELINNKYGIRKVQNIEVFQLSKAPINKSAIAQIKEGLQLCNLYFSRVRNISCTLLQQTCFGKARNIFVWNNSAKENAEELGLGKYVQDVIAGNIEIYKEDDIEVLLISRRANIRAGVRYWTRGADEDGYVANFVETEQIIIQGKMEYSFVQIRGSMPISWYQYPDLRMQPSVILGDDEESNKMCKKHFEMLSKEYGKTIVVCLTEKKAKTQGPVTAKYIECAKNISNISFIYFPMDSICKGNKYNSKLKELCTKIEGDITFTQLCDSKIIQAQRTVIRTNCLDCIDRTNLSQKYFAQHMMKMNRIHASSSFNEMWYNNGNILSFQYAGTKSRYGDLTMTGKRTFEGKFNDTLSSTKRFFIGTFTDGSKQDEYDVVTKREVCTCPSRNSLILFLILLFYAFVELFKTGFSGFKTKTRKIGRCFANKPRYKQIF